MPSSSAFGGGGFDMALDEGMLGHEDMGALEGMDELARELGWDAGNDRHG
jgi:hypothetical protein